MDTIRKNAREWAKRSLGDVFKIKQDFEEELKKLQTTMAIGDDTEVTKMEEEIYRKKWKETNFKKDIF